MLSPSNFSRVRTCRVELVILLPRTGIGMTSLANIKRKMSAVPKRIDSRAELYPSLDYSFHNAQRIEDAIFTEPRAALETTEPIKEGDRYYSYGMNFNHNLLSGPLETLPSLVRMMLVQPEALSSLDLSFNMFTEIPAAVTLFPSLKYFYFHKNLLSNINEIQKLLSLNDLKYLTLHGNPIEVQVPYLRSYVLSLFPSLRSFNCTGVSKGDLNTSANWVLMNKALLPKYFNKIAKK